jgi:hypothetical protein
MELGARVDEAHPVPECPRGRLLGGDGLDETAALVTGRPDDLLEEGLRDALRVMFRVDGDEIDRSDVAAGPDGWSEGEDRAADHETPCFGDEDAGLRQIDHLSQQVRGPERALAALHGQGAVAQGDEAIDVRDARCSDQVFHAEGATSQDGDRRSDLI